MPNHILDEEQGFLRRCFAAFVSLLFFCICLSALLFGPLRGGRWMQMLLSCFCSAAVIVVFYLLRRIWARIPLWLLLFLCFALKLAFVLMFRIEPASDYQTFFITAVDMSRGVMPEIRDYLALFPHVLGYAGFLSIFLRIFGESTLVPVILNVLLSVLSAGLLFGICRRLISRRAAVLAVLIWTLYPSQTIYNMYVLSEPLYTAFLLGAVYLVVYFLTKQSRPSPRAAAAHGLFLGLICACTQSIRPVGMIMLFAILLLFVFFTKKESLRITATFLLTALWVFLLANLLTGTLIDHYLGEKSGGYGYSIYVGLDGEYGGMWNEEAAHHLDALAYQEGATAQSVHKQMLEEGVTRFKNREYSLPWFVSKKIENLMGFDNAAVIYYSGESLGGMKLLAGKICDLFWYVLLILTALGSVFAMRGKSPVILHVLSLYSIGLVLAHLLTEAAQRYHYSMAISLIPLAVFGLEMLLKQGEKHLTKKKS